MGNETASALPVDAGPIFRWQDQALDTWQKHQHRGIVAGMTGTGKTMVAIKAIRQLRQQGVHLASRTPLRTGPFLRSIS